MDVKADFMFCTTLQSVAKLALLLLVIQSTCDAQATASESSAPVLAKEASATIALHVKDCYELAASGGTLYYEITSSEGVLIAKRASTVASKDAFVWNVKVPSGGVYQYEIMHDPQNGAIACSIASSLAIVPGAQFNLDVRLGPGTPGDEFAKLHIYGVFPAGYNVSVTRYDDDPPCGAVVSRLHGTLLPIYSTNGFYDATESTLRGRSTFGISVARGDTVTTFRITAATPNAGRGVPSIGTRFDVSKMMVTHPNGAADTLACLSQ